MKGAPFLFEVRDLWPAFAIAVGVLRQPQLIRLSEWLERFLYRHADRVMVNSPGFVEHVRARGARMVEMVPNGSDTAMFDPSIDGSPFRRTHGLEAKWVALYAGAHGLSNNLEVVLEAARLLGSQPSQPNSPEIAIVLLGDGKEKFRLQSLASQMSLKNVCFLPPIPKADMPQALAAADACIAILKPVALYGTVYPNKVFDYMAAGKPVLLAIDGVIRQVVEEARAGLYSPPGDAAALTENIRRLACDAGASAEMGAHGRQAVLRSFDRPVLAMKLAEILEAMSGSGQAPV